MSVFVISRLCRDCVDGACAEVCPVDAIFAPRADGGALPNQLVIHPGECIECSLCEPVCPWEAIFELDALPEEFSGDVAINARVADEPERFDAPDVAPKAAPSVDDVRANWARWRLASTA